MTWTYPLGGNLSGGGMHNVGSNSLTTHAVGNLVVLITTNHDNSTGPSGRQFVNGVSSSRISWEQVAPATGAFAASNSVPSPNTWCANIWFGTVISVGSDTVTLSWAFADDSSEDNCAMWELHSSVGSWRLDTWTNLNSSGASNWPALTPAGSGEAYLGFAWNSGSSGVPSTNPDSNGFHYDGNADGHDGSGNGGVYNLSYSSGTQPTWTDSSQTYGLMVLVAEGQASVPSALVTARGMPVTGPVMPYPQAGSRLIVAAASSASTTACATAEDIIAGGAGSWVNPTNAEGPPDGSDATWTAP